MEIIYASKNVPFRTFLVSVFLPMLESVACLMLKKVTFVHACKRIWMSDTCLSVYTFVIDVCIELYYVYESMYLSVFRLACLHIYMHV